MQALTFFFAFVAVLALIGVAAWLVRRFAGNRLGTNSNRGRMPRLAVIDAAAVDGRRRLVLVRRDNIEHLLMIGGPTDIVIEPNIVRAIPGRDQISQRPGAGGVELPPRGTTLPDTGQADVDGPRIDIFDYAEPQMPELPPRPVRPAFADEVRRPAATLPERRSEQMPSRATSRNEPVMPRPPRQNETPKPLPIRAPERAAAPPPIPSMSTADQNLAEMAQRLEAALRQPASEAPPVAPEPPPGRAASSSPSPVVLPSSKSGFENLENEMASLLGRPKTPS